MRSATNAPHAIHQGREPVNEGDVKMAHILKIANSESMPVRPKPFVLTETARDILRSANGPEMTMVAGAAGTGKTLALRRFCSDEGFDAMFMRIAAGEGNPNSVAENLLLKYGRNAIGMSLPSHREELFSCIGFGRVLVIDNAHHLDKTGLEWLHALGRRPEPRGVCGHSLGGRRGAVSSPPCGYDLRFSRYRP